MPLNFYPYLEKPRYIGYNLIKRYSHNEPVQNIVTDYLILYTHAISTELMLLIVDPLVLSKHDIELK